MKPGLLLILTCAAILTLASEENSEDKVLKKLDYIESKLIELQKELGNLREEVSKNRAEIKQNGAKKMETSLLCRDVTSKVSGVYQISINNGTESFPAFCEQNAHGGGWLVVQHRFDGSVDFDRNWDAYRKGFGSAGGEYWIGLDRLHRLTSSRKQELLIEMKSFSGKEGYAQYKTFVIGGEMENFTLKTVDGYSGTAGEGLAYHEGANFSTLDHNNNVNTSPDFTTTRQGGWWYGKGWTNLNGPYINSRSIDSMFWYNLDGYYTNNRYYYPALSHSRMMIRPVV